MKFYNIRNTREFVERLSACKGSVELVDSNGRHLQLNDETGKTQCFLFPQIYGEIKQIELFFGDAEDSHRMLLWLLNKNNAAV